MHGLETIKALNEACKDSESEAKVVTAILNSHSTEVNLGKGNIVEDGAKLPVPVSEGERRRRDFLFQRATDVNKPSS